MKTVIVPLDYSQTSLNAARFAAQMLADKDLTLILYNMFEDEEESKASGNYLESLTEEFKKTGVKKVEWVKEQGSDVVESLVRLAFQKAATLIVMGITGKTGKVFMGGNTLKMVDRNVCPVMIIPPEATFKEIKNVAFTSDFVNVESTTPVLFIKSVLDLFRPKLHIINVDNKHYVSLTEEYQKERAKLETMFADYEIEFYFIGMNDFHDAINQFSYDKNIDLIVTVPRYHSFLSTVFKSTHTKKLVYHSSVPILAAHE